MFSYPFAIHFIGTLVKIVLIFSGVFFLLWYYLKFRYRGMPTVQSGPADQPVAGEAGRVILPLKLQAFERFVLFLERINPSNLIMRLDHTGLTSLQYQTLLVRAIREEFEYNLSQQLYLSTQTWELVRNAKEEMIALINQASAKAGEQATAGDLVKIIFDLAVEKGKLPSELALEEVKQEFQDLV